MDTGKGNGGKKRVICGRDQMIRLQFRPQFIPLEGFDKTFLPSYVLKRAHK